jgi:hypothetical protein
MEHRAKRKQSGELISKLLLGLTLGTLLLALCASAEAQQVVESSREEEV